MNTSSASATTGWRIPSPQILSVILNLRDDNSGIKLSAPRQVINATIMVPFYTGNTGSIAMPKITPDTAITDPEEIAIARMSTKELIAEVRAVAGLWADRDDVEEFILSGRDDDRVEKLYATFPESTDKAI